MTRRDSRRRPLQPRPQKSPFFLPVSIRRYPRWRSHHPADDWNRLAPPPTPPPQPPQRSDFILLALPGRSTFRTFRDRGLVGKVALLFIAAALLIIEFLC